MRKIIRRAALTAAALGVTGASVLALAPAASASTGAAYLREGSTGYGVKCVQQALAYGAGIPVDVDQDFGPKTKAAVEQFQRNLGISVDGVVGPQTGNIIWNDDQEISTGLEPSCYPYVPTTS